MLTCFLRIWSMLMTKMLRADANLLGETQERKMTDQVKKNEDIKENDEILKRPEKK